MIALDEFLGMFSKFAIRSHGICTKWGLGVNVSNINSYIKETTSGPSVISSLRTFLPDDTGQAKKVRYDQIGTTTGRLTVKSGPAILTLPQKYRDVISSRYDQGKVIQIDFVSVEPRVLPP